MPVLLCRGAAFVQRDVRQREVVAGRLARTVVGTVYGIAITVLASYALLERKLPFRRGIIVFLILPMYVYAGLIPYYVVISKLSLPNNFLVYILPHGFYAFNMILIRTYMESIPDSLTQAARIDGAGDITILFRVVVPLSLPIIAVISLFLAVWQWNSWFDAMLFVSRTKLHPLSMLLHRILRAEQIVDVSQAMELSRVRREVSPLGLKMAVLIVTTVPVVFVYPFSQRYFIKGIMVGAVKE